MINLYDVLEICLQELENGADLNTVLSRYPEFAEELRPLLETSMQAKSMAASDPSPEVLRRGKAKVLQQSAQMREAQAHPSRRIWTVPLRRTLVSLVVIAVLFISSTRLVRAASTTLPGDNLYPVKRTWEDVLVLFTFNLQARQALEVEHETERLHELNELFAEGRSAEVEFAGTVTSQNGNQWLVAKIPVQISAQTELDASSVAVGDAVRIKGHTQADGTVLAERVESLPAGIPLPQVEDDDSLEIEQENHEDGGESHEGTSGEGSGEQAPAEGETKSLEEDSGFEKSSVDGVVNSISDNVLVINGQALNISGAEVKGTPKVGAVAKVEGYLDASGVFIVTKIEFENKSSDSGGVSDNNSGEDPSSNDESDHPEDGEDHSGGSNSDSSGGDNKE